MITPRELQNRYAKGDNITELLREQTSSSQNSEHIIEVAYDLQTGSYVTAMADPVYAGQKDQYVRALADIISELGEFESVMEAGVGEATTFSGVLSRLGNDCRGFGFDLSWSRVAAARQWLDQAGVSNAELCTGSLLNIPFADNSIDVVYTSHSIEPNGGREEEILKELYRVARQHVVLLEPGYEWASEESQARMDHHGYCKQLNEKCKQLGYNVQRHELFSMSLNPLNPTALTVISKTDVADPSPNVFACPRWNAPLRNMGDIYFCEEGLVAYPVLNGIPCLRVDNGILASQLPQSRAAA